VGQVSRQANVFRVFAMLLLPVLLLLGLTTLARVAQTALEDSLYATGINRIRHFYVEAAPETADYFVLSTHDDWRGRLASSGLLPSRWQPLFATPTTVAVINGVLAGSLGGLVISWFAAAPLPIAVLGGAMPGIALVAAEMRMMIRAIRRRQAQAALFPTPP
jgi:hypothetical protein